MSLESLNHICKLLGAIFDHTRVQCDQLCYRFCGIWPSTWAYLRARAYLHGGYLDTSRPFPHPFRIWYYRLAFNFVPRLSSFRMDWCGVFYLYWYSLLTYCQATVIEMLMNAKINPKSVAGYLATFKQFI